MKNNLTNKEWWAAALVRAIKTVAQAAVATIGAATLMSDVNWMVVISASLFAGILSILTSIAGLPEVDRVPAKWVDESEEAAEEKVAKPRKSKK